MQTKAISQIRLVRKTWEKTFSLLRTRQNIIIPFAIAAGLEVMSIIVLFYLIQPPLVKYISPIALRFWGERFLHYPLNLLLLSQLFSYVQLMLAIVLGTFMSGVTISAVCQYRLNRDAVFSLNRGAKKALSTFVHLSVITIITVFLIQFVYALEQKVMLKIMMRETKFLGIAREFWPLIGIGSAGLLSGVVQSVFAFAQTIVIVDDKNCVSALIRNFRFVSENFFTTLMLVLVPLLVYLPVSLLKGSISKLMQQSVPEVLFIVLGAGIVLTLFINVIITVSVTIAYMERGRELGEEVQA
jgi:hypothetical protein